MRLAVAALCVSAVAAADPPPPDSDVELRLKRLEQSNDDLKRDTLELKKKVEELTQERNTFSQRVDALLPLAGKIGGYMDFGFFFVSHDQNNQGSGIRSDSANRYFPEWAQSRSGIPSSWVFYGDPLATAINSRGEPADTSESRAITFNPVGNGGRASFILNSVTMSLFAALSDNLTFTALIDFVARGRDVSQSMPPTGNYFLGDFIDVKLAYLEYIVPIKAFSLSLYAGKLDSVLGYEYRVQESPDRTGVTPSLICRYTCGHPLGVKARAKFFSDRLIVNVAVVNGTSFTEYFPFYDEIDANNFKTVQGRLSYRFPVGAGLEIGASGAFGAQDNQNSDSVYQWHYGFDVHLDWHDVDLAAEFVNGKATGDPPRHDLPQDGDCGNAPCLDYLGAYGQIAYRLFNWLTPYARVDWRNALHRDGDSFVYISNLMRETIGLHSEIGPSVIVKAEYTFIQQLGRAPQFPSDVFTSSLVVKF